MCFSPLERVRNGALCCSSADYSVGPAGLSATVLNPGVTAP